MTAVTGKPNAVSGEEVRKLEGRLRAMTITVVVLAVALVGLGAWMVYDLATEPETAATSEVAAVLEDYTAAWNDYDGDALLSLVTDYYTFVFGSDVRTGEAQAEQLAGLGGINWHAEEIGDVIMVGSGPRYFVAEANRLTSDVGDGEGISSFIVVEDGDTYKIAQHTFVGS